MIAFPRLALTFPLCPLALQIQKSPSRLFPLISLLPFWKPPSNINHNQQYPLRRIIMAATNKEEDQMDRLEKNATLAENIIADIYSKLSQIQNGSGVRVGGGVEVETPELQRLRQENETLRDEVAKWKELLILRQIRNGVNPIIGFPEEFGRNVEMKKCSSEGEGLRVNLSEDTGAGGTKIKSKGSKSSADVALNSSTTTTPKAASATATKLDVKQEGHQNENVDHKKKHGGGATHKDVHFTESVTSATGGAGGGAVGSDDVDVNVTKLDFRIGLITQVDRHPDADALYVEKIDVGEEKPRTIISGLVNHVPIEEMRNRTVVILANLKPAKMRGILSEGMVMCASNPLKVEILTPPVGSLPGDLVEIEGYPRAVDGILNPKKKIWESVAPHLKTNDKKQATYKGAVWTVPGKGVITTSSMDNSNIK